VEIPSGFISDRSDVLMDTLLVFFVGMPFLVLGSIRLARQGKLRSHRKAQTATFAVVMLAFILFELDMRLSGLGAAGVAGSSVPRTFLLLYMAVHILIAVATCAAWVPLVIASWRRFDRRLPGTFSARHKIWGKAVFAGVCLCASTGAGFYYMLFLA
jgi:putative membrane protein